MRRKSFFENDDFFADFNKMHEVIEKMMEESLKDFQFPTGEMTSKPLVYGFSYKVGENGKPVVSQFGNLPSAKKKKTLGEFEPLVDVINAKNEVRVIAELPGVEEKEVQIYLDKKMLSIHVENSDRSYSKEITLPSNVSKKFNSSLKNGILEIVLKKVV